MAKYNVNRKRAAKHFPINLQERRDELRKEGYEFEVSSFKAKVTYRGHLISFDVTNHTKSSNERLGEAWLIALTRADSHRSALITGANNARTRKDCPVCSGAGGHAGPEMGDATEAAAQASREQSTEHQRHASL